jgi:hypothetical protein
MENVKMRTIKLAPKFIMEALQGKEASLVSNLPEDVELLDLKFDLCSNQILAVIRSDSFKDIAELYPIPEFKLTFTRSQAAGSRPNFSVTHAPKTANVAESEPAKKAQVQPSPSAGRMEEEFTPEQRKLLSFSVDGECVIVKPIQFLKAEWDDINDVVRGLGGRWVKGDIISYWEIPLQQR